LVNTETHNFDKSVAGLQSKETNFDEYEEYKSIHFLPDREHRPFPLQRTTS